MKNNDVDILLVEDNPNDAELAQRALRKLEQPAQVVTVRDGAEALDFLFGKANGRPKVIFLDLKLPKVDGIEVLRKIRSDDRTRTIPVVVLTSSNEDRDVAATYSLGVNSYVVKPVEFETFSKTVSNLGNYWLRLNKAPL
jgi:CheY-like chemotaxis protein